MNPNTRISLLITSCDRHDLLKSTLDAFLEKADIPPQQICIYEDSDAPKPQWLEDWPYRQRHVEWIQDGGRRGQAYACARLIREAKYEYICWQEDDFLCQKTCGPFIAESKKILDENPDIIQVSLRGDSGWHPLLKDPRGFMVAEPYWRGVWGGFSWNTGLRRTDDMKRLVLPRITAAIGQVGLQHEERISKDLLDMGYRIADLNRHIVVHVGGGRSRAVESIPPLPKTLIAIPTCFSFDYETHGGGKDCESSGFHQNGPNAQTEAVRATWGKDFQKFPNVTVKFFYGKPADGYPRQPLADEVFLECGDGYDSLIQKTIEICKYVSDNGFKVVYKADTDTWVYAERLLMEIVSNHFDYAGYLHANVCSGGPGYILSDRACRIIATQGRAPQHPYAEDCHVSRVLEKAGIQGLMLPAHRPGFSAHFYFGDQATFDPVLITDDIVSAHAVFPDQMLKWHAYKEKISNK